MTFLGPSGSGKTTLLNAIAGFEPITSGTILVNGVDMSRTPSYKRDLGMVFQNYALFPHMTALDNVAFPLKQRKLSSAEATKQAREALEQVGLAGFENRLPKELSGGQQQRVAVARAIVYRPSVLLMDEPLGALDKRLREQVQTEIARLHRELGLTFIYVTHDQDEALALSDRIAIFNEGKIQQVGTPAEIYEKPETHFVAQFLGESTFFDGVVRDGKFAAGDGIEFLAPPGSQNGYGTVLIRPENIRIVVGTDGAPAAHVLTAEIADIVYLGASAKVELKFADGTPGLLRAPRAAATSYQRGERISVSWEPVDSVLLPPSHSDVN